ncbi:MAG: LptF/LptG family permease [Microscillaceae bacterium]|jgi:lipopolysaccharide export system permease protein|nr:LptF/LptG family permease [Microscillaceae bacterium]
MKKIDKLILQASLGPFLLTLAVVVFILLIQQMSFYIDDLLGKGLGYDVFAELLFYFALHLVPLALPLAILLSSLITFGNLGEHFELTAMKSSGISLVRVLTPIFIFSVGLAVFSFWFNDQIVPQANLKAYSLLWDIKQKSPSLSLKEGAFYNGIPGYSIKVNKKFNDGKTLKEIMIYNHTQSRGNRELIVADSGRMYTILDERYLVLELFKGKSYHDQVASTNPQDFSNEKFVANVFDKSQIVFNLSSFDMKKTDENLFKGHKIMHTTWQLFRDIDSLQNQIKKSGLTNFETIKPNFRYHYGKMINPIPIKSPTERPKNKNKKDENKKNKTATRKTQQLRSLPSDSLEKSAIALAKRKAQVTERVFNFKNKQFAREIEPDTLLAKPTSPATFTHTTPGNEQIATYAVTQARNLQATIKSRREFTENLQKEYNQFVIEMYKKFTFAFACITMFFIGAPLGAIIKKGGIGVPVLVAIVFFIFFYVINLTGEKWVKESFIPAVYGMWAANVILMSFGLFFLRQAKNDSRLFEADFYYVLRDRIKERWFKKASTQKEPQIA